MSTNPTAGSSGPQDNPWSAVSTAPGHAWPSPQDPSAGGVAPADGDATAPQHPGHGSSSVYGYSTPQDASQPGYGSSGYGSVPPYPAYNAAFSREHPQGTLVLILGIVSITVCQLTGPFAWIIGRRALAEIDANPSAYSNRSMTQAGMTCGIVGTVLLVLSIVGLFLYFGLLAAILSIFAAI